MTKNIDLIDKEVKRRGVNCAQVVQMNQQLYQQQLAQEQQALMYLQQQQAIQQAQQRAQQESYNISMPRMTHTNCRNTYGGVSCTTY